MESNLVPLPWMLLDCIETSGFYNKCHGKRPKRLTVKRTDVTELRWRRMFSRFPPSVSQIGPREMKKPLQWAFQRNASLLIKYGFSLKWELQRLTKRCLNGDLYVCTSWKAFQLCESRGGFSTHRRRFTSARLICSFLVIDFCMSRNLS